MSWPTVGIIAAAVGLAAAVLLGAWWLWWRLPKRQVNRLRLTIRDAKARADVEDNFRKTIGQLLGGAAVLIGAALAYVQFTGKPYLSISPTLLVIRRLGPQIRGQFAEARVADHEW
jgi:hypothetical protein